jgi:hypothetical protein
MSRSNYYFLAVIGIGGLGMWILLSMYSKYMLAVSTQLISMCETWVGDLTEKFYLPGLIALILILISLTLGVGKLIFSYLKTQQQIDRLFRNQLSVPIKLEKLAEKYHFPIHNIVVIASNTDYAATVGIIKPKILLSSGIVSRLSKFQLEAVFLHEYYHFKSGHGWRLLLSEFFRVAMYFLPIIHLLVEHLRMAFEQESDRYVIGKQGGNFYLRGALYKFVSSNSSISIYPQFSLVNASLRINSLNKKNTNQLIDFQSWRLYVSMMVIAIWVGLWMTPLHYQVMAKESEIICNGKQCSVECKGEAVIRLIERINHTPVFV